MALLLAAASDVGNGLTFNLGGERAVRLKELASLVVDANGGGEFTIRSFPEDRKRIDIGDYYADDRLIREVLGWGPKVPLREGLAKTVAYYRAHLKYYL